VLHGLLLPAQTTSHVSAGADKASANEQQRARLRDDAHGRAFDSGRVAGESTIRGVTRVGIGRCREF